jgi:CMP-N,N'-diacetyllegionaminic acid synthase
MMRNKSDVIAVICARGGSKGLPRKNLKLLDGEPLIARAVRHAKESRAVDVVLVTTDDEQIAAVAREAGAEVPFIRPAHLSGDLATTEETLKHALITYEAISSRKFEITVFLTSTDVFRSSNWITEAVRRLRDRPELDSVFVGYRTHKNFWELQDDGTWIRLRPWMATYSSRQIRRFVIREDTGLACASRAQLWREGRRIGDKVDIIVNDDDFTGIDIHREEDLMLAQAAVNIRRRNDV